MEINSKSESACPPNTAALCAYRLEQLEKQLEHGNSLMHNLNMTLVKVEPWIQSLSQHKTDHEKRIKDLELAQAKSSGKASILAIVWSSIIGLGSLIGHYFLKGGGQHP